MNNRNLIFQIALIMCLAVLLGNESISHAQEKNYHDKKNGFSIILTSDWKIERKSMPEPVVFYAASPWESEQDQFSENLVITIVEEPGTDDLEEVQGRGLNALKKAVEGFQFRDKGKSNINGQPSVWAIVSTLQYGVKFTDLSYMFAKGTTLYILTFKAETSKFSSYEKRFRNIAETFKYD